MENIKRIMRECMEKDNKKIQILLSTFNGEKYLREQLDSFVKQSCFEKVKVLIRDDGSTDNTIEILKEYRDKYGFQVLFGENLGVNGSYEVLLHSCDEECLYFALSDQDDVWLPQKLDIAISRLEKQNAALPAMFFSLSCITDENLKPIGVSQKPVYGVSFYNAMVQNVCPGHTQVFNRVMLQFLKGSNSAEINVMDWWIYLIASGLGQVIYEPRYTVLHRQHGKNAVGYEMHSIKKFFARFRRVRNGESVKLAVQLECYRRNFGALLSAEYEKELDDFLDSQESFLSRLSYIKRAKVFRQAKTENMYLYLLYLGGKYCLRG